jgi:CDP-diacylglycerol--glycerol-3-phosphate 3-phosphatidyltransferase
VLTERGRAASRVIVDPLARAMGRLGFTPDGLTVVGMLLHLPVAVAIARGQLVLGAGLLALAAAFDALDGTLARATGTASAAGAFLDSNLDRISEIAVFAGLAYFTNTSGTSTDVLFCYLAITGSLMVSYARARSEAAGLDTKVGILGRFERMLILVIGLAGGWVTVTLAVLAVGAWLTAAWRIVDAYGKGRRQAAGKST